MIDWNDVSTWQILVVDDEVDNLEIVAEILEFRGAQVQTAANGKAALELLETFPANLILTDLSMPVMDGWVMRSEVKSKANFSQLPVVALSAHAIAGDKERALDAGFDGYLTKPINIHTLVDDIRATVSPAASAAPAASPAPAAPAPAVEPLAVTPAASVAPAQPPAAAASVPETNSASDNGSNKEATP